MALTPSLKPFYGPYGILWLDLLPMKTGGSKFCARPTFYSAFFGGRTVAIFVEAMACGLACLATDVGADGSQESVYLILGG